MFTGTHDDRSERCGWAVVLLRAMIMTVETIEGLRWVLPARLADDLR